MGRRSILEGSRGKEGGLLRGGSDAKFEFLGHAKICT